MTLNDFVKRIDLEKDKDKMTMLFTSIRPWPNNL